MDKRRGRGTQPGSPVPLTSSVASLGSWPGYGSWGRDEKFGKGRGRVLSV